MIAVGLSTMAGRLMSGYLVDRIFAPFRCGFLLPACRVSESICSTATVAPVAGIISLGLASGTEIDMTGFPDVPLFRYKRFGQLYGYLFAFFVVGSAIGPAMMGLAFERLHSYEPALWTFGAFMIVASAAILGLGPYRYPPEGKTPAEAPRVVDAAARNGREGTPSMNQPGQILTRLMAASEPNGSEASGPPTSSVPRSTGKLPVFSMIPRTLPSPRHRRPNRTTPVAARCGRLAQGVGVEMVEGLDDARAGTKARNTSLECLPPRSIALIP